MKATAHNFRYPLGIDAGLGRLAVETEDAAHVEQLMRQVLLTNPGERVNRPDFGCGLTRMIFAPNTEVTAALIQVAVFQALETWLGDLIDVADVQSEAKEEVLDVRIAYILRARQERRYLNLEVGL